MKELLNNEDVKRIGKGMLVAVAAYLLKELGGGKI